MTTFLVFNTEVLKELADDKELSLVFYTLHSGYDSDIDPIHNKDYIIFAKKKEATTLNEAKDKLRQIRNHMEHLDGMD